MSCHGVRRTVTTLDCVLLKDWGPKSYKNIHIIYRGVDKSLARPVILFDGENISFDASLVIYINYTNYPPITTINRIYEHQNLPSL